MPEFETGRLQRAEPLCEDALFLSSERGDGHVQAQGKEYITALDDTDDQTESEPSTVDSCRHPCILRFDNFVLGTDVDKRVFE